MSNVDTIDKSIRQGVQPRPIRKPNFRLLDDEIETVVTQPPTPTVREVQRHEEVPYKEGQPISNTGRLMSNTVAQWANYYEAIKRGEEPPDAQQYSPLSPDEMSDMVSWIGSRVSGDINAPSPNPDEYNEIMATILATGIVGGTAGGATFYGAVKLVETMVNRGVRQFDRRSNRRFIDDIARNTQIFDHLQYPQYFGALYDLDIHGTQDNLMIDEDTPPGARRAVMNVFNANGDLVAISPAGSGRVDAFDPSTGRALQSGFIGDYEIPDLDFDTHRRREIRLGRHGAASLKGGWREAPGRLSLVTPSAAGQIPEAEINAPDKKAALQEKITNFYNRFESTTGTQPSTRPIFADQMRQMSIPGDEAIDTRAPIDPIKPDVVVPDEVEQNVRTQLDIDEGRVPTSVATLDETPDVAPTKTVKTGKPVGVPDEELDFDLESEIKALDELDFEGLGDDEELRALIEQGEFDDPDADELLKQDIPEETENLDPFDPDEDLTSGKKAGAKSAEDQLLDEMLGEMSEDDIKSMADDLSDNILADDVPSKPVTPTTPSVTLDDVTKAFEFEGEQGAFSALAGKLSRDELLEMANGLDYEGLPENQRISTIQDVMEDADLEDFIIKRIKETKQQAAKSEIPKKKGISGAIEKLGRRK